MSGSSVLLITGCQRSGTTVLAMALEAHPSIDIFDEDDDRFHVDGELTKELDLHAVRSHRLEGGRLAGFKAPRDSHRVATIGRRLSGARVVWVERDVHQTVASMLSLGMGSSCWAETHAPREIRKHLASTGDPRAAAILREADEMALGRKRSVVLATLCWLVKRTQLAEAQCVLGARLHRVDYRLLVTEPHETLALVLAHLDLAWDGRTLAHSKTIDARRRPGGADPSRPIDQASTAKWHEQLSTGDLDTLGYVRELYERPERK